MNEKTKLELKRINDNIPREWKDKLMKHVIDRSQENAVKITLNTTTMPADVRAKLEKDVLDGVFVQEYDAVDEEVAKKIDEYLETEVNKALEEGKIDAPEPNDPMIAKMKVMQQRAMENKAKNAVTLESIVLGDK